MKRTRLGHRIGALLLAIVMVLSVMPMTAFAADGEASISETTETVPEVTETEPEVTETEPEATETEPEATETEPEATETEPEVTETEPEATETEPEETEPEETVEETTEETMDVEFLDEDIEPLYVGDKPAGGKTQGQPFKRGTGGSTYFRIPAMVTLKDGTIVAATDARWNGTYDSGGNDTIVSYSKDNGANWRYTFANYMGDNGNVYNADSTCFIDPALATDGSTVYMLVTLFPGGRALSYSTDGRPASGDAFNDNGTLKLKKRGEDSYNYYLDGYQIYSNDGTAVEYTVDKNFGNLFYRNADYQVVPTTYLCLTKSTDGGASWSDPRLLDVKNPEESFYGVGPGRGLVTSTGRIIFPCYTNPTEHTSFIYSDDKGETWHRTAEFADVSSETTLVEADGKLYAFFRCSGKDYPDIPYYVSNDNGSTWTRGPINSQIDPCTSCQMNAITYSQKIDGKTAILLSCPTGSSRGNGKIHVGLVNGDNTLDFKYASNVISSSYSYSCLTELNDGSVALLAETGSGVETFYTFKIEDIAKGATIGGGESGGTEPDLKDTITDDTTKVTVSTSDKVLEKISVTEAEAVKVDGYTASKTYTITVNDGKYTDSATVKIPYDKIFDGCTEFTGMADETEFVVTREGDYFICNVPHFSNVTIAGRAASTAANQENVDLLIGGTTTKTQEGVNNAENVNTDKYDSSVAKVTVTGQNAAEGESTYTKATPTCNDMIGSNNNSWQKTSYYYNDGSSYYPVYAKRSGSGIGGWRAPFSYTWGYSTTDQSGNVTQIGTQNSVSNPSSTNLNITVYTLSSSTDPVPASTTIAIEGLKAGKTYYTVGDIEYVITVTDPNPVDPPDPTDPPVEEKTVEVTLFEGQSKTLHDMTGDYTGNVDETGLNKNIATVEVERGALIPSSYVQGEAVTSITSGKQYILVNEKTNKPLTNEQSNPGLLLDNDKVITAKDVWTIDLSGGNYYVQDTSGQYLNIGSGTATVAGRAALVLTYADNCWDIAQDKQHLNNYQGLGVQVAGWFYGAHHPESPDANSRWAIYEVTATDETYTTDITITGVRVGDTSVKVGNTTYEIHVIAKPEGEIPVDAENSPVVGGEGQSIGKVVTKLNLTAGAVFDLNISSNFNGTDVVWVSGDDNVVTVDSNGIVRGVGVGNTKVYVTVEGVTYSIPVVVHPNGSGKDYGASDTHGFDLLISEIEATEVYYSLTVDTTGNKMDTDLEKVQVGEVFHLSYPLNTRMAFDFFGAPNAGYALTFMAAPGSAGDYMALQDKEVPENCDFFTKKSAAGYNQKGIWGDQAVADVIGAATATDPSCDGGMGFTRGANDQNNVPFTLSFRSEKLPEITKIPVAIRHADGKEEKYADGMTAVVGDEVFFQVVVHKDPYQHPITYSGIQFSDTIAGMVIYNEDRSPVGSNTVGFGTAFDGLEEVTKTYYVGYKVKDTDLDTTIKNTAELTHTYKSKFSSGSFDGFADAEAKITATDFKPKDIVIDFGLPVELDFTHDIQGNKTLIEGKADYGEVDINGKVVTYTPNKVLLGADTVTLILQKGNVNEKENTFEVTFKVYPASNVLYEAETFMANGDGWNPASGTAPTSQDNNNFAFNSYEENDEINEPVYGYESNYANATGTLGGWSQTLDAGGKTSYLTTEFSGNGFDLIGECGPTTGNVVVLIKTASGTPLKAAIVDTSHVSDLKQVPLAHLMWKDVTKCTATVYGTYRNGTASNNGAAVMSASGTGMDMALYEIMDDLESQGFDLNDVEFIYFNDASPLAQMQNSTMMALAEDDATPAANVTDPSTKPGGGIVIDGFRVYTDTSNVAYIPAEKGVTYTNVLDAVNDATFAAYVEADANKQWSAGTYEANGGPQNEIYLAYNQGIAFKAPAGSVVQISARAVTGTTAWNNNSISSNTEMYYEVGASGVVTIRNTANNNNLLALGNIKSMGSLQTLSTAEIEMACAMLSGPVDPVDPPVDPEEPVDPPVEPEVFTPDWFKAKTKSTKLAKTKIVAVNVTTSMDVEYVTVNGERVTGADIEKHGKDQVYVFTYTQQVGAKDKPEYEIVAYNADGVASEPIHVKG